MVKFKIGDLVKIGLPTYRNFKNRRHGIVITLYDAGFPDDNCYEIYELDFMCIRVYDEDLLELI